jgi:hypothetical protein
VNRRQRAAPAPQTTAAAFHLGQYKDSASSYSILLQSAELYPPANATFILSAVFAFTSD